MFKNQIALVTAGAQGIGYACACLLAERGAKVYLADWNEEQAKESVEQLRRQGYQAEGIFFDAFQNQSYVTMIATIINKEKTIDLLVNNFGGTNPKLDKDLVHTEIHDWEKNILSNLNSVFLTSKMVIPYMVKHQKGSIVNISSLSSLSPDLTGIAYGTVKAGINHITQQTAIQYARYGIRCNAVLPGMIATDAVKNNLSQAKIDEFLAVQPIQKIGLPQDIAEAVAFLLSNKAEFITGVLLPVMGGIDLTSARYPADVQNTKFDF
ncbi:MAG: SDR family NAD(P)-dependent oxidoreductase [Brevinema sp.]